MFRLRHKRKQSPLGVAIHDHGLSLAQFQCHRGAWRLVARQHDLPDFLRAADHPDPAALGMFLRRSLAEAPFMGRQVISAMPPALLWQRHFQLPPMAAQELPAAVTWQVAQALEIGPDQFKAQYYDAGETWQGEQRRREIIAVAACINALDEHMAIFREAGLHLRAIDVAAGALARRCIGCATQEHPATLIVHIGASATLMVIADAGRPVFLRQLTLGAAAVGERLTRMNSSLPEPTSSARGQADIDAIAQDQTVQLFVRDLSQQIASSLRYYAQLYHRACPVHGVLLVDDHRYRFMQDQLAACLQVNLVPLESLPLTMLTHPVEEPPAPQILQACAIATGLCLYDRHAPISRRAA